MLIGERARCYVRRTAPGDVQERIRELEHTRHQLVELRRRLRKLDPEQCDAGAVCSAIRVDAATA